MCQRIDQCTNQINQPFIKSTMIQPMNIKVFKNQTLSFCIDLLTTFNLISLFFITFLIASDAYYLTNFAFILNKIISLFNTLFVLFIHLIRFSISFIFFCYLYFILCHSYSTLLFLWIAF